MSSDDTERRLGMNAQIIDEFRANGGKVGGPFEGTDLLLLHTRGAKSGEPRINPVAFLEVDGVRHVFASNGGRPPHPGWYFNVVADSAVRVEAGTETYDATARVLEGAERDRVFAAMAARHPQFNEYQKQVDRVIPVVALDPR